MPLLLSILSHVIMLLLTTVDATTGNVLGDVYMAHSSGLCLF